MKLNRLFGLNRRRNRRLSDQIEQFPTVVGAQSVLKGNFNGRDNHLIFGQVTGDCDLDGVLMIGEGGRWHGQIRAQHVIVAGEVRGDIYALGKLELTASAVVMGDLEAPMIAMAEGAAFDGKIRMQRATQVTRYTERRGRGEKGSE